MDMNDVYVGTGRAPLLCGGDGGAYWPPAGDEVIHTATMAAPRSTGSSMGGGGFVRNGNTPSPSEAAAFAGAALAASDCSIPPGDVHHGGREEQQPQRHSVYAYPLASSSWSSDGGRSRSRKGVNYDWGPRPHKESWQAIDQGFEDDREERVDTVRRDGGSAGARGHGDGILAKRQAGMHALEQELIERARGSKSMRNTTTPASPVTARSMVFPPPSRDLSHLLQDNRIHRASESFSANPRSLAGVPMNGTTGHPITTAVRRRRCSPSPQENRKPLLSARHSDEQEHDLGRKGSFERSQEPPRRRARTVAGPTIPRAGRRNVANRCQHSGCSRGSTFGAKEGAKKPTHCATHKRDGMVKITSRQCADELCSTAPSYGFQGKRASFCSKHKMPGMVNVVTPRCQSDGCGSCASYGHPAERRPLFCARHAQDGMLNVVSRKCLGVGCIKNPSYGHPGDRRASFCVDHHLAGMSNIVSPKCLASGCDKAPSFGKSGDRKAKWCKTHQQEES